MIGNRSCLRRIQVFVFSILAFILVDTNVVSAQEKKVPPKREGFTLLLTLGLGYQTDPEAERDAIGLNGLNLGLGGFITEKVALFFRVSGTNVPIKQGRIEDTMISAVGVFDVQYWANNRFNFEGGIGYGVLDRANPEVEFGVGILLSAGYALSQKLGKHNFQIGVEYAPVFLEVRVVHNLGLNFGYQFF